MRTLSSDCFYYFNKIGSHQARVRRAGKNCLFESRAISVKLSYGEGENHLMRKC